MWPFKTKHKTIERNRLRSLLFKSFDGLDHKPLDMKYNMFNNRAEVISKTPRSKPYIKDAYDCDDRALDMMQENHGFAIGMVKVPWNNATDHILNIIIIDDELLLYDPASKKFQNVDSFTVKDIWI